MSVYIFIDSFALHPQRNPTGDVLIGMDLLSPTPKLHNYYTQRLPSRFNPLTILDLQSGPITQKIQLNLGMTNSDCPHIHRPTLSAIARVRKCTLLINPSTAAHRNAHKERKNRE